jgi:DNA-binding XRE family transcriptional regulator
MQVRPEKEATMEKIIVAVIIIAALGITIYKIFFKPACSCGCSKCKPKGDEPEFDPLQE